MGITARSHPVTLAAQNTLQTMLDALSRLEPVRVARTEAERRAIFRMRYEVYVEELKYPTRHADHARREVHGPEDDGPDATLYYTGSPTRITASLRVRAWAAGQLPRAVHRLYSLDRFDDIDTRVTSEVSMLMARRDARGSLRVLAATAGALEATVRDHGAEVMVASCIPSTLRAYLRLGLRPFGGRLFSASGSVDIPLIGIAADLEHHRRCASPWYPTLRRLAARGQLPTRDIAPLMAPLQSSAIEVNPARVLEAVSACVARHGPSLLKDLSADTRRRLLDGALIMEVPAGIDVIEEGIANRDLFAVLDGELSLVEGEGRGAALGAGDVFGELGFLLGQGRATARVHSTAPCRLLHLRHGALQRSLARRADDAAAFHAALARSLARQAVARGGA